MQLRNTTRVPFFDVITRLLSNNKEWETLDLSQTIINPIMETDERWGNYSFSQGNSIANKDYIHYCEKIEVLERFGILLAEFLLKKVHLNEPKNNSDSSLPFSNDSQNIDLTQLFDHNDVTNLLDQSLEHECLKEAKSESKGIKP